MSHSLFLLDAMALIYRAHFAFIKAPIFTTAGVNTSALYGFTNALLEIIESHKPTHLAVAFDTAAPTHRHELFEEYKAQRDEMPEDIATAIPAVRRLLQCFRIPILEKDGFEADDIIGTYAQKITEIGSDWSLHMVTPDKDFGQLVSANVFICKPGRGGAKAEILGPKEVCERWDILSPDQVIDILALTGDVSDNIPGIPGIGDKTAAKLIKEFGSLENLLEKSGEVKGKMGEKLRDNLDKARLARQLVEIDRAVPLEATLDDFVRLTPDDKALQEFLAEYEFNAIGRRLYGDSFKAGRGAFRREQTQKASQATDDSAFGDLFAHAQNKTPEPAPSETATEELPALATMRTIRDTAHSYRTISRAEEIHELLTKLAALSCFCFDTETTSLDTLSTRLLGLSFSWKSTEAVYVSLPWEASDDVFIESLIPFREFFARYQGTLIGHNLKFDLAVLRAHGIHPVARPWDTMLAHSLIEPDQRHSMDFLSEAYLGYSPVTLSSLIGEKKSEQISMVELAKNQAESLAEYAAEDADITWQLAETLRPLIKERDEASVLAKIELPLLPVLVEMEATGIALDQVTLHRISGELADEIKTIEAKIREMVGFPFNMNSPRQLGEVLFDHFKLLDKPKKTRTGQYQTDEATLQSIEGLHPVIGEILNYRGLTKLKSTYVDALPAAVHPRTGRVHTTFHQLLTATGRLASSDPNLQNIPIRTERGREIRAAFVPGEEGWVILSADYSQIELRLMAELSGDVNLRQAFEDGLDIHAATAARLYHIGVEHVTPEMRRAAKTVNFGIIYGISAFGLSQRLGIPRKEGHALIEEYFRQYPGIASFMESIVTEAREKGYTTTLSGRKRWLRDITSANAMIRTRAERMAINTPLQGSAADMIKIAMVRIARALKEAKLQARMLLQVHDELVFELPVSEIEQTRQLVISHMCDALPVSVPIIVDTGTGANWLEAH